MNRRTFCQRLGAFALASILLVGTLPTTGCTVSDAQVKADAQAIATAVGNIAVVLKATNPDLADKLAMAATSLSAAAANYSSGSTVNDINTAADLLEVALAAIPQTAAYAPLVGIAVAAIDVLINSLPGNQMTTTGTVTARAIPRSPNPYRGQAKIQHRFGRSMRGDLTAAWNANAKKLGVAPI